MNLVLDDVKESMRGKLAVVASKLADLTFTR
jgi:small nuclear ribonucleoprotein (snRNP)-like protein